MNAILLAGALISATPVDPNEVYEAVVVDLATIPQSDRQWIRYLSLWPTPQDEQAELHASLGFWRNSISWNSAIQTPVYLEDRGLWRIDLRVWGWDRKAWEAIAKEHQGVRVVVVAQ